MAERKMTPKQARFVSEYLIDLNATAAAKRAGYSEKTAEKIGHQLLEKTRVAAAIAAAMNKREVRTEITADRVIKELADVAFLRSDEVFTIDGGHVTVKNTAEMSDAARRALISASQTVTAAGGTITVKLCDKIKALELLGRHLALFTDKLQASGPDGGPLLVLGAEMTAQAARRARQIAQEIKNG